MTRKEVTEFFSRRDEAWQRHDVDALETDHAEDGQVESPVWGNIQGRSAIKNVYREWFASFPDVKYRTEHLLIDENRVAQFVKMIGIHKGDFCGFAPTGKRFEVRCAFLFFMAGGKIERELRLYDFTGVLLQLGVLNVKPSF